MLDKFLIYAGFFIGFAWVVFFSFGADFEPTVVFLLWALVLVAAGAALRLADAHSRSGETTATAPTVNRPQAHDEAREARAEDGA